MRSATFCSCCNTALVVKASINSEGLGRGVACVLAKVQGLWHSGPRPCPVLLGPTGCEWTLTKA